MCGFTVISTGATSVKLADCKSASERMPDVALRCIRKRRACVGRQDDRGSAARVTSQNGD